MVRIHQGASPEHMPGKGLGVPPLKHVYAWIYRGVLSSANGADMTAALQVTCRETPSLETIRALGSICT